MEEMAPVTNTPPTDDLKLHTCYTRSLSTKPSHEPGDLVDEIKWKSAATTGTDVVDTTAVEQQGMKRSLSAAQEYTFNAFQM